MVNIIIVIAWIAATFMSFELVPELWPMWVMSAFVNFFYAFVAIGDLFIKD